MLSHKYQLNISGLTVDVVRKSIKNLHLGVYPPAGRIRIAVPDKVTDEAIRLAIIDKLPWIKRKINQFELQPRQSKREMVNGESHYFLGQRYRLFIVESQHKNKVVIRNNSFIDLYVRPDANLSTREKVLHDWYRDNLKTLVKPLLEKWQLKLGVEVNEYGIKKMKTKWGSCNIKAKRIWLNLELAKKPPQCLEYVIVHELVHLLERLHNDRFTALMDTYLPNWRQYCQILTIEPLGHCDWGE